MATSQPVPTLTQDLAGIGDTSGDRGAPVSRRAMKEIWITHTGTKDAFVSHDKLYTLLKDEFSGMSRVELVYMKLRYKLAKNGHSITYGTHMATLDVDQDSASVLPGFNYRGIASDYFQPLLEEVEIHTGGTSNRIFPETDSVSPFKLLIMASPFVTFTLIVGINYAGTQITRTVFP